MEQWLSQVPVLLLVVSRVAGVATISPLFSNRFVPPMLRAAFAFLLAFVLLPVVDGRVPDQVLTSTGLLAGCVLEMLVGLVIGFVSQMVFAAVQMAGSLVDLDMGFMNAQIYNPVSGHSEPITTTLFQSLALTLYLVMNGHHQLIRALAGSYAAIPPGGVGFTEAAPLHIAFMFSTIFAAAVQMVLPFIAVMLLATMAMAGITRAVPQIHIFAVGMGAKAVAGMGFLVLLMPYLLAYLERLFAYGDTELLKVLQLMR